VEEKENKRETTWEMSRVVLLASCLECSSSSGPGAPLSIYSKLAGPGRYCSKRQRLVTFTTRKEGGKCWRTFRALLVP